MNFKKLEKKNNYIDLTEVKLVIDNLIENAKKSVKELNVLQDYSGNYDEIYNVYKSKNTDELLHLLTNELYDTYYFNDGVERKVVQLLENEQSVYLFYTYIKFVMYELLGKTCNACNINSVSGEVRDFVLIDDEILIIKQHNEKGALIGAWIYDENEPCISETKELFDEIFRKSTNFKNLMFGEEKFVKKLTRTLKYEIKNLNA